MEDDDTREGEWSSSRPATADRVDSSTGGSHGYIEIEKEILDRLLEKGIPEVVSDPSSFREQLHGHFERLPTRSASS
jgi:hypothetical protein